MVEQRIKRQFVKEVLSRQAGLLNQAHQSAMQRMHLIDSGKMFSRLSFTVSAPDNADGVLSEKHVIYQRFLDMKKKGLISEKRKSYPIHNRIIFGHYNSIAYKLMYYLTEDTIQQIKSDLENGQTD